MTQPARGAGRVIVADQWCTAVEPGTGWRCVLRLGEHSNPELHQSGSGGHMHHFYSRETA